jgi:hypothetical protein
MALFKSTAAPTLDQRLAAAAATKAAALSVFVDAVADMRAAVAESESVAADAQREMDTLAEMRDAALAQSYETDVAAERLAGLLGL